MRPAFLKKMIAVVLGLSLIMNFDFYSQAVEINENTTLDTVVEEVIQSDADSNVEILEDGVVPAEDLGVTDPIGETNPIDETDPTDESNLDDETDETDDETDETDDETIEIIDEETPEAGSLDEELLLEEEFFAYYYDGSIQINVSAPIGVLPKGTVLVVSPISDQGTGNLSEEDAKIQDKYDQMLAAMNTAGSDFADFLAYDISFWLEDEEIEPNGDVSVDMQFIQSLLTDEGAEEGIVSEEQIEVLHVDESGAEPVLEQLQAEASVTIDGDGNLSNVQFMSDEFSMFLIGLNNSGYLVNNSPYVSVVSGRDDISRLDSIIGDNKAHYKIDIYVNGRFTKEYPRDDRYFRIDTDNITSDTFTITPDSDYTISQVRFVNGDGKLFGSSLTGSIAASNMTLGSKFNRLNIFLVGSTPEVYNTIGTVSTKGKITLNLFDYDTLDSSNNVNGNTGINAGKDLRFSNPNSYWGNATDWEERNYWTGSSQVRQGIIQSTLTNGYPKLSGGTNQSLDYLFSMNPNIGKTSIENVDNLFVLNDGYYVYDSDVNYAFYDTSSANASKNFAVYETGEGTPGFFPFIKQPNSKGLVSELHYFGLTMEAAFIQPLNGTVKNNSGTALPMVFDFSGDDDVWVFIDGDLALDLGGIHGTAIGSINFNTGVVTINNPGTTVSSNQVVTKTFSQIFSGSSTQINSNGRFYDGTAHTIKLFYLERGNDASNCKIKFNLPVIEKNSINISKKVSNINTAIPNDTEYQFRLYTKEPTASTYTLMSPGTTYYIYENDNLISTNTLGPDSIFKLKQNQTARFIEIPVIMQYRIEEINVDSNKYLKVNIGNGSDGTDYPFNASTSSAGVTNYSVADNPMVVFNNYAKTQEMTLEKLISSGTTTDTFKIKLTFGSGDSVYKGTYRKNGANSTVYNADDTISVNVGDKIIINNVPIGIIFKVQETNLGALNASGIIYDNPIITSVEDSGFGVTGFSTNIVNASATATVMSGKNAYIKITNVRALGNLRINKQIDKANLLNGDPIFTFKIERLGANGTTILETLYRTVRFSTIGTINEKYVLLSNIPVGQYRVTELDTMRFNLISAQPQVATVYGGSTPAQVNLVNHRDTTENYSHTDVVVNEFTIGTDGTITINKNTLK